MNKKCKIVIVLFAIVMTIMTVGCEKERKSAADGHSCRNCGSEAEVLAGTDSKGELYFCRNCYNEFVDKMEREGRIAD